MTTYNEGDLVRATKGDTVIQGRVGDNDGYSGDGGFYLSDVGWSESALRREDFTVELIEKAKSPTVKALEDAPRGAVVQGDATSRMYIKSRNLKWYEFVFDYQGDGPSVVEATEAEIVRLADWLEQLPKFRILLPYGTENN